MARGTDQSAGGAASFANAFISAFSAQGRSTADDFNRYYIITAAAEDEYSYTSSFWDGSDYFDISLFTYYFATGLGYNVRTNTSSTDFNADSNNSGAVSLREAYEYVQTNTADRDQTVQVFPADCNWMSIVRAR